MTTDTDKLVEMALASGAQYHITTDPGVWLELDAATLGAFASAHIASLCGDVEPVAFMFQHSETGRITFVDAWQKENGWATANPRYKEVGALHGASTVAALKSRADALQARVDAMPEGFTQGIDAAAKMLDKMADDYSNAHAVPDPDTGVYEFGRGGKEDYYNTLRELADDVRSIVYAPGERENTAQTLKAAKDAAFEQAANLLECEYAEDAKQKRRLDQIAQHIRDLKKRSS